MEDDYIWPKFLEQDKCPHKHRIMFELKSGRIALECPACGDVIYQEKQE